MAAHKIVHFELMGPDGAALSGFYQGLFGWNAEEVPGYGGYHLVSAEETGVGGAVGTGNEHMPSYMTMYVEVESVDAHLAKAAAGGATVVVPRTVVPGMASFGLFTDPAGNLVGVVEEVVPPAE